MVMNDVQMPVITSCYGTLILFPPLDSEIFFHLIKPILRLKSWEIKAVLKKKIFFAEIRIIEEAIKLMPLKINS